MKAEITPLLIITKLEEFDYPGATAIAVMMLVASFVLLLAINFLQWWSHRHHATGLIYGSCFNAPCPAPRRSPPRDGRAAVRALAAHRRGAGVSGFVSVRAAGGGFRGGVRQGRRFLFSHVRRRGHGGGHQTDVHRRRHRRAAELHLWRGGGVGDCQIRFSRQNRADHAH